MQLTSSRILYALAGVALVSVLGLMMAKTRSVDLDGYNEIVSTLRRLKQVDAEWNVDVLHAKTGIATHYDGVAGALPLVAGLEAALSRRSGELWHGSAASEGRLAAPLDAYRSAMERKIAAIERFKSQNAILRNSSRFLPVAATELIEAARASSLDAERKLRMEQALGRLLADTMTYSLTPEDALRVRVEVGAQMLHEMTAEATDDVRQRVDILAAHVNTLLQQHERGAQLLAELAGVPTAKAIDALADAHAAEHDRLLTEQQAWRQALIAYAVGLLLLLGFAAWRLYRSYRLLNTTNQALHRSNRHLKESQVHLVQAEKMSALGQMVAGIAHEINTPLAYVKGTFDVLGEQLAPINDLAARSYRFAQQLRDPQRDKAALSAQLVDVERTARDLVENRVLDEVATLVKDGIHGIDQISEIVQNLKNFSRLDRAKVADFSLQAGLDSTLLLARHLLKGRVEVRKEYGRVPAVTGSPSQINQVFLNIITNAVQAMPERAHGNVITLRTAMEDARTVRVEIRDNGSGIPKDVMAKIFDPFFTTKPIGQGTGMGLSISFKIIQEHGGRIVVDSEVGVGTVFTILLPVKSAERAEPASELLEDGLLMAA